MSTSNEDILAYRENIFCFKTRQFLISKDAVRTTRVLKLVEGTAIPLEDKVFIMNCIATCHVNMTRSLQGSESSWATKLNPLTLALMDDKESENALNSYNELLEHLNFKNAGEAKEEMQHEAPAHEDDQPSKMPNVSRELSSTSEDENEKEEDTAQEMEEVHTKMEEVTIDDTKGGDRKSVV